MCNIHKREFKEEKSIISSQNSSCNSVKMHIILVSVVILMCLVTSSAFHSHVRPTTSLVFSQSRRPLSLSMSDADAGGAGDVIPVANSDRGMEQETIREESRRGEVQKGEAGRDKRATG